MSNRIQKIDEDKGDYSYGKRNILLKHENDMKDEWRMVTVTVVGGTVPLSGGQ